jgi:hypothetical protein
MRVPSLVTTVRQMADEVEELFMRSVDIGIADVDMATDEEVVNVRAVVQRAVAHDPSSGQERKLLLVYDPASVSAVVDALRAASERALAGGP